MVDLTSVPIELPEILNFLGQKLQLKKVCREIRCQKIVSRVAHERNLQVKPEEIKAEVDRVRYENRIEHPSEMLIWLADQFITLDDLELAIFHQLLAEKLAKQLFSEEVERLFAEHQHDFDQILLYRITVPYPRLCQEIFYRIEEAEIGFYEAAHLYNSELRLRLQCGYEGRKYRRDLKPEIAEAVANAAEGEVIGPFQSSDEAYDLLLVEEVLPAELSDEVKKQIIYQKFEEWLEVQLQDGSELE